MNINIETNFNKTRLANDYSKITGEPVTVEFIAGAIYVFGSELATLRLFRAMPNKRQGYSAARESFYFSIEL
jgi:hypothetical protein